MRELDFLLWEVFILVFYEEVVLGVGLGFSIIAFWKENLQEGLNIFVITVFIHDVFQSIQQIWPLDGVLLDKPPHSSISFGHVKQSTKISSHCIGMIIPVYQKEPVHKFHWNIGRFQTITNKHCQSGYVTKPSSSMGCRIHNILYIDLGVKMLTAGCLHFGESMKEVMDEKEVVEKVFSGESVLFWGFCRIRHDSIF